MIETSWVSFRAFLVAIRVVLVDFSHNEGWIFGHFLPKITHYIFFSHFLSIKWSLHINLCYFVIGR